MGFYKKINLRSRKAMTEFLKNHERYDTMNSCNRSTSYANCMKIHASRCMFTREEQNVLYDLIQSEEFYFGINDLIGEWNAEQGYLYQAGFNGRSGGYLVMYVGGREPSGYKSYCPSCYQQRYKTIEESGTKCGKCGQEICRNYTTTHMKTYTHPGRSIDQDEDYTDWAMEQLRDRVKLVQSFDKLCDDIVMEAKHMAGSYEAVEETVLIPQQIKVLKEKAA